MIRFKRSFLTGFTALFPAMLTVFVVIVLYRFVDANIGKPVNAVLKAQLKTQPGQTVLRGAFRWPPERFKDPETLAREVESRFPSVIGLVFGLVVAVGVIYLVGRILTFLVARKALSTGEQLVARFPIVKLIYPHAKQFTEFVFSDKKLKFNAVVAVEYPRKGLYSLGFITNDGLTDIARRCGQDTVIVFLPTSPTPVSGYTIVVPREEVIPLSMTADEALRYIITGGVVVPSHLLAASAAKVLPPSPEAAKALPAGQAT